MPVGASCSGPIGAAAHLVEGAAAIEVVLLHDDSELLLRHHLALHVPGGGAAAVRSSGELKWILTHFSSQISLIHTQLSEEEGNRAPAAGDPDSQRRKSGWPDIAWSRVSSLTDPMGRVKGPVSHSPAWEAFAESSAFAALPSPLHPAGMTASHHFSPHLLVWIS